MRKNAVKSVCKNEVFSKMWCDNKNFVLSEFMLVELNK